MNLKWIAVFLALSAPAALAAPVQITYRTYHYACQGGQKVSVAYVNYGKSGPMFAVLTWKGQQYALAEAISASGARYAGLAGPANVNTGLEWWEHQGQATLSTFINGDTTKTKVLLTCKAPR